MNTTACTGVEGNCIRVSRRIVHVNMERPRPVFRSVSTAVDVQGTASNEYNHLGVILII